MLQSFLKFLAPFANYPFGNNKKRRTIFNEEHFNIDVFNGAEDFFYSGKVGKHKILVH